ncbi:DUF6804 family protein [Aquimarina aggregata]|uniref:DUF6804 family protein n=1 Tax=Aquimarina aggregata TaxID=1642818 RepID=UPI0024933FAB|nr:DUF6804 family protein [Aquimarina aggregata]
MIIKYNSLVCALLLGIAVFTLPSTYYIFLRILVTLGAILIVVQSSIQKEYLWMSVFIVIGIIFNPFIPIYLFRKLHWIWIDLLVASFFLIDFFRPKPKEKVIVSKPHVRKYDRDKMY